MQSHCFGMLPNALSAAIAWIALLPCGAVAAANDVPDGVDLRQLSGWDIVVSREAIASEIYAAEEFQQLFAQASGVELPIVHKIDHWEKHVFIGPGRLMQASSVGFSVEDLGPEDLRIVVRDQSIVIAGGRPRGTLYGVYTFLEDYVGVRFLTHDHTHIPPARELRRINPLDRVHRPPFANYRAVAYRPCLKRPVFAVRSRNNSFHDEPRFGGVSPFINIGHSLYRQVPYNEYSEQHPEYFVFWGGKRVKGHYCLTNPELVPIVRDAVLREIGLPSSVERRNFAVSQDDTVWQYCQCEQCAAIDGPEESHMGALLTFVNAVADKVAKTHPEIEIGTLAYGFSRKPPKTIKCRPNVEINLTTYGRCHVHSLTDASCPANVEFFGELKKWSRICEHLYLWDYHFSAGHVLLPYPDLFLLKPNIKTSLQHGVEGAFMQAEYSVDATEMADLRFYLLSRLMWNPELDDRAIVAEFIDLHYAEAAPPIRRFVDLVDDHYKNIKICHVKWQPHGLPVDEDVASTGVKLFVEALGLAKSDAVRARVEKAAICAYRAALDPIFKLKENAEVDPADAERLRPLVEEFFRLCEQNGIGPQVNGFAYGFSEATRKRLEEILSSRGE